MGQFGVCRRTIELRWYEVVVYPNRLPSHCDPSLFRRPTYFWNEWSRELDRSRAAAASGIGSGNVKLPMTASGQEQTCLTLRDRVRLVPKAEVWCPLWARSLCTMSDERLGRERMPFVRHHSSGQRCMLRTTKNGTVSPESSVVPSTRPDASSVYS